MKTYFATCSVNKHNSIIKRERYLFQKIATRVCVVKFVLHTHVITKTRFNYKRSIHKSTFVSSFPFDKSKFQALLQLSFVRLSDEFLSPPISPTAVK